MSEDTARAIGASGTMTLTIDGVEYKSRPLSLKQLTEVERDCLSRYKKRYLETWKENAAIFDNPQEILMEKVETAARWDVYDLPTHDAYDTARVTVNDQMKEWLEKQYNVTIKTDITARRLLAAALDSEMLSPDECKRILGSIPKKAKIAYVHWWITGCADGMVTMVWTALSDENGRGPTRDRLIEEFALQPGLFAQMAREIEHLSTPDQGNG